MQCDTRNHEPGILISRNAQFSAIILEKPIEVEEKSVEMRLRCCIKNAIIDADIIYLPLLDKFWK